MTADEMVDGLGPTPPYHNAYINFNVTLDDGSPASGYRAYWYNNVQGGSVFGNLDPNGETELSIPFKNLGDGRIQIKDPGNKWVHIEYAYLEPDEVIYRNISLPPPAEPYVGITGKVLLAPGMGPMEGVTVNYNSKDELGNGIYASNITDASGAYNFLVQNVSQYSMYVAASVPADMWVPRWAFFQEEGVDSYEFDLIAYPKFQSEQESRIRVVNGLNSTAIPGYMWVSSMAVDNSYRSFEDGLGSPDQDGWRNFSSAMGEIKIGFSPIPDLFENVYMQFSQYRLNNGTGEDIEISVDPSFLVPVELTGRNVSTLIEHANCYYYRSGVEDFGIYSLDHSNKTDADGTMMLYLPHDAISRIQVSAASHLTRFINVDTTGPGPYSIDVTLEEYVPLPALPTTSVNITVLDDLTGIPVPGVTIRGSLDDEEYFFSFSETSNSTGVWSGTIAVGTYYEMYAYMNLGLGKIEDVVVLDGGPNNLEIRLDRHDQTTLEGSQLYHFYAKDEAGQPVPGASMKVSGKFNSRSYYTDEFTTDDTGRMDFLMVPGGEVEIFMEEVLLNNQWNPWAMQKVKLTVEGGVFQLPDVTLYNRWTPNPITGFIRDSTTMEPIMHQMISAHSIMELEDNPTRIMGPMSNYMDGVEYLDMQRYTNMDGFFRVYGLETVVLEVSNEDYFAFKEEIQVAPVRADIVYDILMDPLPEFKVWMNGTLVDENGDPIAGELNITDFDHPAMNGHDIVINETGEFSIELYPSNYTLRFFNETLTDTLAHDLGYGGTEGLLLQLIPYSTIGGQIVDWEGVPIEGINVTLENEDNTEVISWMISDPGGNFSFKVIAGNYDIVIAITDLYGDYRVNDITVNGWDDWWERQYLANRTIAILAGTVLGSGGFYAEGVPGVTVTLMDGEIEVRSVETNGTGIFDFGFVNYGTYDMNLTPPENLLPVEGLRSGYEGKKVEGLVISGTSVTVDPVLDYVINTPPGYVNVTHSTPNGTDEFLNAPIVIVFSETMDQGAVEGAITITPAVTGLDFIWSDWGEMVTIYHDDLLPNTTYTVEVGLGAVSFDGWPLWGEEVFSWTFTTGDEVDPWSVASAEVILDGMNLTVTVEAPTNLTIYIMIMNAGYHRLTEGPTGTYTLTLDDSVLEHNRTYSYFFTDSSLGDDRAPAFAGEFTTPLAPVVPVVWEITSVDVVVKSTGDWMVEVLGTPGLTIFIVIEGVGSFELLESNPGLYQVNVHYENFEKGKTYDYHFSDEADGTDLAPAFIGSITDPRSTGDDDDTNYTCLLCSLVLIVVILILVFVILLIKRRRSDRFIDDEE